MPRVKILTDSTADLPPGVAEELGITVLPLTIQLGNKKLRDGIDVTPADFVERMARVSAPPITLPPTAKHFEEAYAELTKGGNSVVAIHVSSKLSQTWRTASRAAAPLLGRYKIVVIDSQLVTVGLGMLVTAAGRAAANDAALDEVVRLVRGMIPRIYIGFFVETLDYLERGGRIGKAQSLIGSILRVNPIIGMRDGEVCPFGRERSRAKAIDHLCNFAMSFSRIEGLAVEYAVCRDEAEKVVERLGSKFPKERIYRSRASPVIGTHTGPGLLVVTVLGDK